jgi:hypothetical protein
VNNSYETVKTLIEDNDSLKGLATSNNKDDINVVASLIYGQLYPDDFKEIQTAPDTLNIIILPSDKSSQETNNQHPKTLAFNITDLKKNYDQALNQIKSVLQPGQELSIQPTGTFTQAEQDLIQQLILDINTNPDSNNNC